MRCSEFERWISDGLDKRLAPNKDYKLQAHLRECASCRDFELRARRIQGETQPPASVRAPDEYWRESLNRLRRNLEGAAGMPEKRTFPGWGWRWIFAAAPLLLAAVVGLVLLLRPGGRAAAQFDLAADERLGLLTSELGDNPDLENAFNSVLESSIGEHLGAGAGLGEASADNPLLGQEISDEELAYIIEELKKELRS